MRIADSHKIDQESLFNRFAGLSQLDLVNNLKSIEVSHRSVTLDDQSVTPIRHNEVADIRSAFVEHIFVAFPGVFAPAEIEFVNEQSLGIVTNQRLFKQRKKFFTIAAQRHPFKTPTLPGTKWMVESRNSIRPVHSGQPWSVTPLFILQVGAVIRTGDRTIVKDREISEEIYRSNVSMPSLNFQKRTEIEALDIGPRLELIRFYYPGNRSCESSGTDGAPGKFSTRIDLGFNIEAHLFRITAAFGGFRMAVSRTGTIVFRVKFYKIEYLLQSGHHVWMHQPACLGECDGDWREIQVVALFRTTKHFVAYISGLYLSRRRIFNQHLISLGVGTAIGLATLLGRN